ncbi:MAG: trehalose-phosphatase [Gammaproteobacteria bacterium]|nr:trehalose-phosphatase [Gammaproteobacteria bacterium]
MLPVATVPGDSLPALFLDLDGTLVEIAQQPELVHADPELLLILEDYEERFGSLAVVSGRAIADIDRVLAPLQLPAAGIHGLELRFADRRTKSVAKATLPTVVRERLQAVANRYPGMLLEDKGLSVALHFRAAPAHEPEARAAVDREMDSLGDDFTLQRGKMVLEIRPNGATKGTAVAEFMQCAPYADRLPVYVGDDVTDEDAFDVVNEAGGMSVRVGTDDIATRARWRLDSVSAVRQWIKAIVRQHSRDCA